MSKPWVGKSVVIIDDSAAVREQLKSVFEACGVQVKGTAENGVIGIELVQKHNPEIVSIDLIMPEMDGVECYKKLQLVNPLLKCVMVSWIGGDAKIIDNLKDIIPSHLFQAKPVTKESLESRLEKVYFPHLAAKEKEKKIALDEQNDLADLGIKVS
jgi:two-component system chemotaxis response regulator CheY